MAEQLTSQYGASWPTDALGLKLPLSRRILLNHAILREAREEERIAAQARDGRAAPEGGSRVLDADHARRVALANRRRGT